MMDLTTLEGKDTPGKIAFLCRKAMQPADPRYKIPACAAVCVYSNLVRVAKKFLGTSGVKVASVATAFPTGLMPLKLKLQEVRSAARDGACNPSWVMCGVERSVTAGLLQRAAGG